MKTDWIKSNYPYFLIGLGISGLIAGIGLAIGATPKADQALREKREELGVEKLPAGEIAKTVWKPYMWTAITAAASTGCIIGGTVGLSVNFSKQKAALLSTAAAAISSSEGIAKVFQDKVAEKIGKDETEKIKEEAVKEVYHDRVVSYDIFATKGPDEEVYLEPYTGQYFVAKPIDFMRAKDILNDRLYQSLENEVLLHELFYEWGMELSEIGWMMSFRQSNGPIDYDTIGLVDIYGRSYQKINYITTPKLY